MTPDHYHIAHLIANYFEGSLTEEESVVLKNWLAENEENQQFFNHLREERTIQDGVGFFHNIDFEAGWKAIQQKRKRRTIKSLLPYLGTAAALLLIALVSALYFSRRDSGMRVPHPVKVTKVDHFLPAAKVAQLKLSDGRVINLEKHSLTMDEVNGVKLLNTNGKLRYTAGNRPGADTLAYNTLIVPKKGFYELMLPDGTKVWLNAHSSLSFPVTFSETQRKVNLTGEAYFEVSKDPNRPFNVEVQGKTVQVLGTKFNVNSYHSTVKATLFEGSVRVIVDQLSKILSPGEEARFSRNGIKISTADTHKVLAWRNGEFFFRKDSIKDILEEIARWYDVEIQYKGERFDKRFSGNISRQLTLPEVLGMLRFLSGYEYVLKERKVLVYETNSINTKK